MTRKLEELFDLPISETADTEEPVVETPVTRADLAEIDETIDQLIENAAMIEGLEADLSLEKDLLAQTQESLLAHLFHLDQKLF